MSLLLRRRRKAEINIVPLIDVLTILIFFFIVSMQFRDQLTLNLTLPRIETAGQNTVEDSLTIGIDRDGRISVLALFSDASGRQRMEDRYIEESELRQILDPLRPLGRDLTVLIKADEDTPLRTVTFVMDEARLAGLNRIRLQSR
jgi:biopolymer transport protein ExbD